MCASVYVFQCSAPHCLTINAKDNDDDDDDDKDDVRWSMMKVVCVLIHLLIVSTEGNLRIEGNLGFV